MEPPFFTAGRVPAAQKMLYPALDGPERQYWSLHDYGRQLTAEFAEANGVEITFEGFRGESFDRRFMVVYCFVPSQDVDVLLQKKAMMEFPYGRGGSREFLKKSPLARNMRSLFLDDEDADPKKLIEVILHVPLTQELPANVERLLNINRSLVLGELGSAALAN